MSIENPEVSAPQPRQVSEDVLSRLMTAIESDPDSLKDLLGVADESGGELADIFTLELDPLVSIVLLDPGELGNVAVTGGKIEYTGGYAMSGIVFPAIVEIEIDTKNMTAECKPEKRQKRKIFYLIGPTETFPEPSSYVITIYPDEDKARESRLRALELDPKYILRALIVTTGRNIRPLTPDEVEHIEIVADYIDHK